MHTAERIPPGREQGTHALDTRTLGPAVCTAVFVALKGREERPQTLGFRKLFMV
jgi:hypothetical protein